MGESPGGPRAGVKILTFSRTFFRAGFRPPWALPAGSGGLGPSPGVGPSTPGGLGPRGTSPRGPRGPQGRSTPAAIRTKLLERHPLRPTRKFPGGPRPRTLGPCQKNLQKFQDPKSCQDWRLGAGERSQGVSGRRKAVRDPGPASPPHLTPLPTLRGARRRGAKGDPAGETPPDPSVLSSPPPSPPLPNSESGGLAPSVFSRTHHADLRARHGQVVSKLEGLPGPRARFSRRGKLVAREGDPERESRSVDRRL